MTHTQTCKCLAQCVLYQTPESETEIGTIEVGDIIEVGREDIEVQGVVMRVVHNPPGAVEFDLEWFSVLPDKEEPTAPRDDLGDLTDKKEPTAPCGDLDDTIDSDTLALGGVATVALDGGQGIFSACAVPALDEASVTSVAGASDKEKPVAPWDNLDDTLNSDKLALGGMATVAHDGGQSILEAGAVPVLEEASVTAVAGASDKEEPIAPCDDIADPLGFDTLALGGVATVPHDGEQQNREACAVPALEEASVTSVAGVSPGTSVGGGIDAVRARVERCYVLLRAAQRQADRSQCAKLVEETSEKISLLEKRQEELRRKTAYCDAAVLFEGRIRTRRECHRRTLSWAEGLLAEQESLRESACPEETRMEAELREVLLAAVNKEVVTQNVVSVHETSRKRVREDDAICAVSDEICIQLRHLKLVLKAARQSKEDSVEPATCLLHQSLNVLGSFERAAARSRPLLSPELAMRISRNKEQAELRRAAKKRRLADAAQLLADGGASVNTDVDKAISSPP